MGTDIIKLMMDELIEKYSSNYSYALAKSGYFDKAVSCLEEAERLGYRNAGAMWNMFRSLGIKSD